MEFLSGGLLTCKRIKNGRCVEYMQTELGPDALCLKESPPHPKKKRTQRKVAPYRMTGKEWNDARSKDVPDKELKRLAYGAEIWNHETNLYELEHMNVVAKAIMEGKKVPKQVLSEYPGVTEYAKKWFKYYLELTDIWRNQQEWIQQIGRKPGEAGLSGLLLTCADWQITGKGDNQVIRCKSFQRTCPPEQKVTPLEITLKEPEKMLLYHVLTNPGKPEAMAKALPLKEDWIKKTIRRLESVGLVRKEPTVGTYAATESGMEALTSREKRKFHEAQVILKRVKRKTAERKKPVVSALKTAILLEIERTPADEDKLTEAVNSPFITIRSALRDLDEGGFVTLTKKQLPDDHFVLKAKITQAGREAIEGEAKPEPRAKPAPKPLPAGGKPWMEESPFTKDEVQAYNRYSHYTVDPNKEFQKSVNNRLAKVTESLENYGVKETPAAVVTAIDWYRKRVYEYYQTEIRSRNYAPPPMVVGPSKYPTRRLEKAHRWEQAALEKLDQSSNKLRIAVDKAVKGKISAKQTFVETGVFTQGGEPMSWADVAAVTTRIQFGKLYAAQERRKAEGKGGHFDDVAAGKWDHVHRKRGRDFHKTLVTAMHRDGIKIEPHVLKAYPNLRGIAVAMGLPGRRN